MTKASLAARPHATTTAPGVAATPWILYLLECRGGLLYTGITNAFERRMRAHASGRGARFTRANPPLRVIGARPCEGRSDALKAEYRLRHLRRDRKLREMLGTRSPEISFAF